MIRTQIQLTEDQIRRLKQIAAAEGRSMADVVRECVGEYLSTHNHAETTEEQKRRFLNAAGKFRSGPSDVAINHDKYLEEIYADYKR